MIQTHTVRHCCQDTGVAEGVFCGLSAFRLGTNGCCHFAVFVAFLFAALLVCYNSAVTT